MVMKNHAALIIIGIGLEKLNRLLGFIVAISAYILLNRILLISLCKLEETYESKIIA